MKTTTKHFAIFRREYLKFQKKLGLTGWKVYFEHTEIRDAYAGTLVNLEGRWVTAALATEWPNRAVNDKTLAACARHECLHLLVGRLSKLGGSRCVMASELEEAEEELIRQLEQLFYDGDMGTEVLTK